MSPTSRYIPVDSKLNKRQRDALPGVVEGKRAELKECRYGDPESALWLMEQLEYFKQLAANNNVELA